MVETHVIGMSLPFEPLSHSLLSPSQISTHTLTNTNTKHQQLTQTLTTPGTRTSPIYTESSLLHSYTNPNTQTPASNEAYMANHPFAPPTFGPVRGRGAFNPAFQPYPAPRGRGRRGGWPAPRGRAPEAGHAPTRLAAPGGTGVANTSSPSALSQPRQIRINHVVFELDAKGSKLTRITRECLIKHSQLRHNC